jgi:type IV pilus assembly protein PilO
VKIDLQQLQARLTPSDWSDFSTYPFFFKVTGVALVCVAILIGGFLFIVSPELDDYSSAQQQEENLKSTFLNKKAMAINLPAYKQQMEIMNQTFGSLLRQLPDSTEVPSLLVDITQAGLGRGLNFELFKPGKESKEGFYAKLPINIRVAGSYHELAGFVSDVAALPRIVTINNIRITGGGKSRPLTMTAKAYTYRYLRPGEQVKPKKGRRRRRR